jgi:dihydroflavonol-4-reductase
MSRQRAVVLGATGHLGQAVVRELLSRGTVVTAATRQQSPRSLRALAVEIRPGDSEASGQIDAWIQGQDLVVDCAAPYPLRMFSGGEELVSAACRRTALILQAVHRHRARLAYVSSFTTLPRGERGIPALEAQWRRSIHPYFEVKRRIEDMLLGAANGLDITVVNPTVCLGPWDGKPRELCFLPQLVAGKVWATCDHTINAIDVRDLASLLCNAIDARCNGVPIALVGHNLTVKELARRACALAGVPVPPLVAPARLAAWSMVWAETVAALAGQPPWIFALSGLLLCDSQPMQPTALQQSLGCPIRPFQDTLRDTMAWYSKGEAWLPER